MGEVGQLDRKARLLPAATPASLVLLAALVLLGPGFARAADQVGSHELDPDNVRSYWTPERMRAATPLDQMPGDATSGGGPPDAPDPGRAAMVAPVDAGTGQVSRLSAGTVEAGAGASSAALDRDEIGDPAAEPFRSHGKVFLTISGGSNPGDFVCSGTAIASNNKSVVWSAGHCVFDTGGGGFATNWMFAPGYHSGSTPFGEWPAEQLATTEQWRKSGNLSYDLGAATVSANPEDQSLTDVVGGRGIAFNQARDKTYQSFGYPAQQPPIEFSGGREFRCSSELGGTDNPPGSGPNTLYIPCDMTAGSSGGGWVAADTVLSVNSYSYCLVVTCEQNLYGPYQGDVAQTLYGSVAGGAEFCGGEQVTVLGTAAAEKLVGTSGRDVFKGGGGADEILGKGGNDVACGGGGKDLLKGKGGKDKLKGNKGNDDLRGGKGKDSCNGGSGKDTARSCEKRNSI